jgi:hypothetical protein
MVWQPLFKQQFCPRGIGRAPVAAKLLDASVMVNDYTAF